MLDKKAALFNKIRKGNPEGIYWVSKGYKQYWVILFIFLFIALLRSCESSLAAEEPSIPFASQFKIAIFKEEGFPAVGAPALLSPEWLYNCLSGNFSVSYLDSNKLSDKRYFNSGIFDLLILPYGETFPYRAFENIKEYLFEGGGILNIAGRPFWVPMDKKDGKWEKINISDPYKEFLSVLGIKYYESLDNENIGLNVTTSLGFSPIKPTHGNIFPYRIPVRDFYFLETNNRKGNKQPVVFIKSWGNPYIKDSKNIPRKWCLIGSRGENNPLNPKDSIAKQNLIEIVEYLSFPIIIHELITDLAAYKQRENVKVSIKVMNNGKTNESCMVDFEFLDKSGESVYKKRKYIKLGAGQIITLKEVWNPEEFKSDFYQVKAILKKNGLILDKEENGFVVINENVLRSGPTIQIKGEEFVIGGKKSLILGVNYYESKLGELMWLRPNILKVREDFKSMQNLGINFVRIHYHHSKWFRDYFTQVINENIPSYFRIADNTALPSERSLRILDAIIYLAQEQNLIFCMDIFSLVPTEMGNPVGWLGLKERIIDKDKIAIQKKFIKLIAQRYKDVPGITWDLWNEPRLEENNIELLRNWAGEIKEVFRENNNNHLITIGDDLSLRLLDMLDYACLHTYEPAEINSIQSLGKPVIFQEAWNPSGCSLDEEKRQAEELKKDFGAFLKTKAAGFVPWQWARQARLWNNAYDSERWDDELGVCVHDDGSLKPAGQDYRALIATVKEK